MKIRIGRAASGRPQPDSQRQSLLANRDGRLYLGGQITSMLGDSSLWLAIGIWVKILTGSSSQAALVWFAFILGGLTGPLTAVLIDRLPLRPVLIAANLLGAADVLALLAVHGAHSAWLCYPVMFGYGVCSALLSAGSSAFMKPMFGTDMLAGANSALATAKQGMNLVAPLLGAGLLAVVGAAPVIIADAVSFAVAATALTLVRLRTLRNADPADDRPGTWSVLSAGVRHVLHTPPIRRIVLAVSVAILALGLLEPAEYSVNSEGLHRAPAFMGVLFALQGAGSIVGGLFAARAVRGLAELRTAGAGLAAASAAILGLAVPLLPVVLAAFSLYGGALTWVVVAQQTQLQRLTPAHLQGRAAGAASLFTKMPQAVGIAIGSALIGLTGYIALLGVIALLTSGATASLFSSRYSRRMSRTNTGPA